MVASSVLENQFVWEHLRFHKGWLYRLSFVVPICSAIYILSNLWNNSIFYVDSNNVIVRQNSGDFFLWLVIAYGIISIVMYEIAQRRSVILKLFPVWTFALPMIMGAVIQFFFVGIYIVLVFQSISIACLLSAVKNEVIYIDGLTGVYNRRYIDYTKKHPPKRIGSYYGIMMDVNNFKSINDNFGHEEGDSALKSVVRVLQKTLGENAVIIRYAGDEFVVFLYSDRVISFDGVLEDIHQAFLRYNEASEKPYELSVSAGADYFDLLHEDSDEFLKRIDQKMYDAKIKYYMTSGVDRRK